MSDQPSLPPPTRLLPGMAAIAVWMFLLSLIGLIGVTTHKLPLIYLVLCIAFAAAGQGLIARRRWGWAMSMAAAILSATWAMWIAFKTHQPTEIGLAVVNLVLFLYLARPEVRAQLR